MEGRVAIVIGKRMASQARVTQHLVNGNLVTEVSFIPADRISGSRPLTRGRGKRHHGIDQRLSAGRRHVPKDPFNVVTAAFGRFIHHLATALSDIDPQRPAVAPRLASMDQPFVDQAVDHATRG